MWWGRESPPHPPFGHLLPPSVEKDTIQACALGHDGWPGHEINWWRVSFGTVGEMVPPEVEFPFGEDGLTQQAGVFDDPAFGTEEDREDDVRTPFAEGTDDAFQPLQPVGGRAAVHPSPGQLGEVAVTRSATLNLAVELGDPAERHDVDQVHTSQDGSAKARTGTVPVTENLGMQVRGKGGEAGGAMPRFLGWRIAGAMWCCRGPMRRR